MRIQKKKKKKRFLEIRFRKVSLLSSENTHFEDPFKVYPTYFITALEIGVYTEVPYS